MKFKSQQEFNKLPEFDKRVFYQHRVKLLVKEVAELRSGKEIERLTIERDEWKKKYEKIRDRNIRNANKKNPPIGTTKSVIELNRIVKSLQMELGRLRTENKSLQIALHSTYGGIQNSNNSEV